MAFKLYPPIIATRLPAFYQDNNDNLVITVPFTNNRAVSFSQIGDIKFRLKSITTDIVNIEFGYVYGQGATSEELEVAYNKGEITFKVPSSIWQSSSDSWNVNVGQYYRLQLAYTSIDDPEDEAKNLYWSSVGMIKFSFYPTVTIDGLSSSGTNSHLYTYYGIYSQWYDTANKAMDVTETVYSYRFILRSSGGTTLKDTGWLLHDSDNDINEYSSTDKFEYLGEIGANAVITYLVKTVNGIEASSPTYTLKAATIKENENLSCALSYDYDNACVTVTCRAQDVVAKRYYIVRSGNADADGDTQKIYSSSNGSFSYNDFTTIQGARYYYHLYALLADGSYITSPSVSLKIDFEDIFLTDGKKQLKIRYNPSLASMSQTILESKQDTIGGKYPFFLRNGNTKYFTFSFGGLITYNMDEKGYFDKGFEITYNTRESTDTEQNNEIFYTTAKDAYNFKREREFRDAVLSWLNNGEVKLFRSASEGNKLIKCMNVQMSSQAQVSRMVWSFTAQAVEADDFTYEKMIEYGFYKV